MRCVRKGRQRQERLCDILGDEERNEKEIYGFVGVAVD